MKKLLAMVLALVMTLSLAVVGSNAAFKDADKIAANYNEAVQVLSGMGVFKGDNNGNFNPESAITRAEVAAIVYRLYTGDVKDNQAALYATYNKFTDMNNAKWAAGYIGYCANAGLIKGYSDTKFGPLDSVTGYQALAMILRAVGYDKNGEFSGKDWQLHVAQTAQQLGILRTIKNIDLNAPASRQLVAEILFRTAAYVPMVTYTAAFGYQSVSLSAGGNSLLKNNVTLGTKNFGLQREATASDKWGRPSYSWTNGGVGNFKVVYATFAATPVASYTTAVSECKICEDLGENDKLTISDIWNDGVAGVNVAKTFTAKNTNKYYGAQGLLMEIYDMGVDNLGYPVYRIVKINTYLAKVIGVTKLAYDNANHVKTSAKISVDTFGGYDFTLTSNAADFDYKKGDMVLVNVNAKDVTKSDILGVASTVTSAQVAYDALAETSKFADGTYNWACQYNLGKVGTNGITYVVYFDQYGNMIGQEIPATIYSYGVITEAAWTNSYQPLTPAYAAANLMMMDATAQTGKVLSKIGTVDFHRTLVAPTLVASGELNDDILQNGVYYTNLYQFTTAADGSYSISAVGTYVSKANISANYPNVFGTCSTNDYTVYLVKTVENGVAKFNTYTGYKNVPSMNNVAISYFQNNGFVTYAFVDATKATYTGETSFMFIVDDAVDGMNGLNNSYYVYVDGQLTVKDVAYKQTLADVGFKGRDVYQVETNLAGEITNVIPYAQIAASKKVTFDAVKGDDGNAIWGTVAGADATYNCTNAKYYLISGTTLTEVAYTDVVTDGTAPAWCLLDGNGYIAAVYVQVIKPAGF